MPRISLHIEADNVEEFHAALAAVVQSAAASHHAAGYIGAGEAINRPFNPEPVNAVYAPELEPEEQAAPATELPAHEQEAPAPRKRAGRKPRAQAAAPVAETPKGNGQAARQVPASQDDFNRACYEYVSRYGVNFGQNDLPKLMSEALGRPIRLARDVVEAEFARATAVVLAAVETNPFNRKQNA